MQNIIEKCFKEHKIASFYFDKEDNCRHLTGFVQCFNEEELLIAHITPRGEYDGFVLNKLNKLYRVDYESEYENKIEHLYKFKKQTHPILPCTEDGIVFPLLQFARDNNCLISLELNNDKITGFVEEYNAYILLQVMNENGIKNGKCVINIDEVETFSCDTDYEQDLKFLST